MGRKTFVVALFAFCVPAVAQQAPPARDAESPQVSEKPLSILYARDANGKYVPILNGVEYDEINQYLINRIARSERARPRQLIISKLSVQASLQPTLVRLDVDFKIEINSVDDADSESKKTGRWFRIPLGFHRASLDGSPEFSGDGKCVFQHDEEDGYVAWYQGSAKNPLSVRLKLVAPVTSGANSAEVSFQVPEATESSMDAVIAGNGLTARVTGALVDEERADPNSLVLKCVGLNEEVRIAWSSAASVQAPVPALLDVVGTIDATVERIGLISSVVRLQLKSSEEIVSFDLRVPASSQLIPLDRGQFEATPSAVDEESGFRRYRIKMAQPAVDQTVDFRIESTTANVDDPINIGVVEVVDTSEQKTVRQFGQIRLFNPQDLRVTWDVGPDVSRVSDPELDTSSDLLVAFEYTRQPSHVQIVASPRVTRTSVTPLHVINVETNRVYLRSVFRCKVRGGGVSEFTIQMQDWEYEYAVSTEGAQVIDQYPIDDSRVRIVLESPVTDAFEFVVRAHRSVNPPDIAVKFPVPDVNSLAPAIIFVAAADNITLDFPTDGHSDFLPDAIPVDLRDVLAPITTTQPVRCFRMQTEKQTEAFRVQATVQSRRVHLDVSSLLVPYEHGVRVKQRFSFDIQFERLQTLRLQLPIEVYESLRDSLSEDVVSTTINGQPFAANDWFRSIVSVNNVTGRVSSRIALPEATIGSLQVEIEYELRGTEFVPGASETIDIPLITADPGSETTVMNRLVISPLGVRVEGIDPNSAWRRNDQVRVGFPLTVQLRNTIHEIGLTAIGATAKSQPDMVRIIATPDEDLLTGMMQPTRLERAWVRSTLTTKRRRDQAVFLVKTGRSQVDVLVSNEPAAAAIRVWVNNQEVKPAVSAENDRLTIPLAAAGQSAESRNYLIELELDYSERPRPGKIQMTIPELELDSVECKNWLWQLTLSPTEHLVSARDDLILAQPWTWRKWFFARPAYEEQTLTRWAGASNLTPLSGGNNYVLRSLSPQRMVGVRTVSRRALVATASGATLAFGLMLIYVREIRRPLVLFLIAVTLATIGLAFPNPALLMAQASILGVVLAVIGQITAVMVRRMTMQDRRLAIPKREDSSSQLRQSWSRVSAPTATTLAPAVDENVVTADSNS